MNTKTLAAAVREAKRFIEAAKAVRSDGEWINSSKESGAVKRASMDLTRALSEMRKTS